MKQAIAALLIAALISVGHAAAQQSPKSAPLSAQASNPENMGWMQGFPPPANKIIRYTDQDFFAFPKLRWTVCNFRALMPNAGVDKGPNAAHQLKKSLDPTLDSVTFKPLDGKDKMTWKAAFDANYTDGVVVLHHGRIVYERYDGCLSPTTLHGAMSVTKSLTGLIAQSLVAEGKLDENALVGMLIPELKHSAFGDATVRQVMDMTTALDYSEDYSDPNAEVWAYGKAASPLPKPKGYTGPNSYFEFLQTVQKKGAHGEAFGYKTVNADAVGWLIARTTGKTVAEQLSERIWSRIGTEREAFYTVDSTGTPFAGGGFNATLRDMARLGQLMLDDGVAGGEQIVPPAAIASIRHGGDKAKFAKAHYDTLPGWSYASLWWVSNDDHGAYAARGVHGQTIWIDPKADMVIARFASNPVAGNASNDPTSLPAYRAVADHLMANDKTPLLGSEWTVEDIAGAGVIDNSQPTLMFMSDGRLVGSATCNRLLGSYQSEGKQLSIKQVGSTLMACPEALMNQERKLLDLLSKIKSYKIDDNGSLLLSTEDGKMIKAQR